MSKYDLIKYTNDILDLVNSIIVANASFIDLKLEDCESIGNRYGIDQFEVLQDCIKAYNELRIIREIESGHRFHAETEQRMAMKELVRTGIISEETTLFTVDEFIEQVQDGLLTDYDGYGEFVSGNGNEFLLVHCHVAWLREFQDEWPYVAWYGK